MEGKKIMVVDDSLTVHKLMKKFLESEGLVICASAKNGKEAVDFFKQHNPDLTFMDITMPIMDGIEALREIKAVSPGAKVVMLSAMGDEEITNEAKALGATLFLQKPFNKNILIDTAKSILGGA